MALRGQATEEASQPQGGANHSQPFPCYWLISHEAEDREGTYRDCEELFKLLQPRAKKNMARAISLSIQLAQREGQWSEGRVPAGGSR